MTMPDVEYGSSLALPFVNSDVLTVYRVREGVNLRFWATDAKNLQPILNRALLEPNDNVFCSTDNILLPFRKVRQRFLSNFFCAPETTGELTDPITGLEWQYLIRSLGCLRLDAKEREAAYDLLQALSMYVTGHYSRSTVLQCFPSLNPCDQVFSASLSSSSSSVCSLASDIKLDASVARKLLVNYVLATPYLVRLFSVPADFWMKMGAEIPHFLLRGVAPLLHLFQVVSSMTEVPIVIDLQQTVIHGCTFDLTAVCSTVAPFCELGIYRAAQGLRRAMSHIKEQFFKLCLAMPQCIRTEADQTASLPRCCSMIHEADFDKACNLIEHFGMIAPYLTSLCRNEKDLPSVQYLPMIEALNLTTYSAHAKVWATSPFIPDVLSFLYHDFSDSGTFLFASYLLCLRCLTRPDMHHYLRPDWLPYQLDLFHAAAKEIMEVHYPNGAPSHQTDDEAWPGSSLVFQFIHHCYIVRQGRHVSLVELLYDLLCFEFINPSDDLTPEKIIDGLADLKLQNWLNICTCRADVLRPFLADPNFFALADRDPFLKEFGDLCLAYVNEYKLINELERQKEPADDNIRSFLITDVDPPLNKSNDVIVFCHGPAEEFYVSQAFFKELIHRRYGIPFGKDAPLEKMIQMFRQERDQWCTRLAVVSPAAITHAANAASTEMQSSVSCSSNKKRKGSEASTSSKRQKTDGEKKKPGRKPQIAILKEELRKAQAALRDLQQNQKKTPEGLPIELELHKAELERRLREQLAKHETGLRKESETLQAEVKLNAKNLEEQAKLLDVLRSTLDVKEKQLEATTGNNKQLHAALEEHATTRLDLQQQLDAKISELDSVKKDLAVAKSYATVKIQDLSKSSKELEESRLALQTKTQELGKTAKELEESKLTLQKTIKELDESRLALQSKTQELGKTNKELEESRVGLQAKAKELDELRRATEKTLELKTQEILLLEKALTKTKTLEGKEKPDHKTSAEYEARIRKLKDQCRIYRRQVATLITELERNQALTASSSSSSYSSSSSFASPVTIANPSPSPPLLSIQMPEAATGSSSSSSRPPPPPIMRRVTGTNREMIGNAATRNKSHN